MPPASGETTVPVSDWTTGTLKIYHDDKMTLLNQVATQKIEYERQIADERDLRYQERWAAQEEAAKNLKEYQNEFRGSLSDLSTKMATKDELQATMKSIGEKIDALDKVSTEFRSRLDIGNPTISTIQQQLASSQGKTLGADKTVAYVIAAISILFGLAGLIITIIKLSS